ncbi:MAG: HNH endonuclease [Chloroflexi bacterium]|nr:HNH endonuclease [Chloroflexota bacterium]
MVLVMGGKAEVLEHTLGEWRSASRVFAKPSVIRIVYVIRRPRPLVKLTRREVFIRDRHTCQYCGIRTRDLTIDHVIPRHRGGKHEWENLVSACRLCNHRKGGRSLEETHMRLLHKPFRPVASAYYILHQYLDTYEEWRKYIPEWELGAEQDLTPAAAS